MLVTDVGDEMCWRQLLDVGDGFGRFRQQHPLYLNIGAGHRVGATDIQNISLNSVKNTQKL